MLACLSPHWPICQLDTINAIVYPVLRNPIRDTVPFEPLDPGSGMGKKSRSGSGIRVLDEHPESYFLELRQFFGLKILKVFYADPDSGSGIFLTLDLG